MLFVLSQFSGAGRVGWWCQSAVHALTNIQSGHTKSYGQDLLILAATDDSGFWRRSLTDE
ncbi:hypothetical protein AGR4A_pAt10211 [Agrobacterium tumefaciens str. B6]|uniref:Uncharacterized protein n=1 Tax=Agrobacterium tumefaciens str. B6 TaxID=1183423 RepID=A0A822VDB7_AGRTU|nr:hypothetical protein AGR4A_pAt10211 [Agrobacterium tumefaciens str. B6]